jgi:hypothetical protein
MAGNSVFPVFIQNKSVATDDEIKIAAWLFPGFEKRRAGNASFGAQKCFRRIFHWRGNLSMPCFSGKSISCVERELLAD